jgi:hypothetical protein
VKQNISGGDLNLPYAYIKGNVKVSSGGQKVIKRLFWEIWYAHVVNGAPPGDSLLDVYLVRPESLVNSCTIKQGISNHCEVLLEVEWEENYCRPKVGG